MLLPVNHKQDYDGADMAEQHYRRAIEIDPKHAIAHNNLGVRAAPALAPSAPCVVTLGLHGNPGRIGEDHLHLN